LLKGLNTRSGKVTTLTNDHAQMVELVDTQDLKSCSRKRSAGSIPALSTKPRFGALLLLLNEGIGRNAPI
jgi:hypothetical protein